MTSTTTSSNSLVTNRPIVEFCLHFCYTSGMLDTREAGIRLSPDEVVVDPYPVMVRVEEGQRLPEGLTAEDLQDAVRKAQSYVGHHYPVTVSVQEKVTTNDGREVFGLVGGNPNNVELLISLAKANLAPAHADKWPHHRIGSGGEQLWATTFEEAFHAARMLSGEFDPEYYCPPADPNEEQLRRYFDQPEEAMVGDALNGGILKAKFGSAAMVHGKVVLHMLPLPYNRLDRLDRREMLPRLPEPELFIPTGVPFLSPFETSILGNSLRPADVITNESKGGNSVIFTGPRVIDVNFVVHDNFHTNEGKGRIPLPMNIQDKASIIPRITSYS